MSIYSEKPQLSILGAGHVATCLAREFYRQGYVINEIYSRNINHAQSLSAFLPKTLATDQLDFSHSKSTVFLIAIKDDALSDLISKTQFPNHCLALHTSGVLGTEVFANVKDNIDTGIFYPLQTFNKNHMISFEGLPIFIEAQEIDRLAAIETLVKGIGAVPHVISPIQKKQLHVAAVFASNFTNRMIAHAYDLLKQAGLTNDLLKPLILQSINNALDNPDHSLTGPARRNDQATIDKHLELLSESTEMKSIYNSITQMILKEFNK